MAPDRPEIVTTVRKQLCKRRSLWHCGICISSKLVEHGVPIEPAVLSDEKIGTFANRVTVRVFKAPGNGVLWPIILVIQAAVRI